MTTLNGLPAHALLVHFIVILAPLTAILAILCALWRSARNRLMWMVFGLATGIAIVTPLTTDAGEWLEHQVDRSALLHAHTELGDTMIYFATALFIAAALLTVIHVRETRGHNLARGVSWIVAALVIAVSVATTVQVYRIGDSGARATWGDQVGNAAEPTTP